MKIVVVIQARTGSTRLPGKVLLPLAGDALLVRMTERVLAASTPSEVVLATTVDASDDPVAEIARRLGVRCVRGPVDDLLHRHLMAGRQAQADLICKIPSDCPLIDPETIDFVIRHMTAKPGEFDFVSNLHPPTWPDGFDVEIMPMEVLETAGREATAVHQREHTTPFIWDQPERFRVCNVRWATGLDYSGSHRLTIDYPEDYDVISRVYDALYAPDSRPFGLDDILAFFGAHPEVLAWNAQYRGVNWYRHHLDELRTVGPESTRPLEITP